MVRCNSHKLGFEKINEDMHKAYDMFCGVEVKGIIWYCSKKCLNDKPKLKYKMSNEEISND